MRKSLSPADLGFDRHDRQQLAKALTEVKAARLFRRIQAVLLVAKGRKFQEAAHITGLGHRSVYRMVRRYLNFHQVGSLADKPRSGRPLAAPRIGRFHILKELRNSPLKLGYRTNVWTVKTLAHRLNEQYRCSIGPWSLRERMKGIGLVCKRPRYFYSEKDPQVTQKKGSHRAPTQAPAAQCGMAL